MGTEEITRGEIAFEGDKGGYHFRATYLLEPNRSDALVEIERDGVVVKSFLWPAYKVWNIAAHAEIRAALEAATPAEWFWYTEPDARPLPHQSIRGPAGSVLTWTRSRSSEGTEWTHARIRDEDARLICLLRNEAPALLARIEALEALVPDLVAALEGFFDDAYTDADCIIACGPGGTGEERDAGEVIEQIMFAWCADHVPYLDDAHASLTDFRNQPSGGSR